MVWSVFGPVPVLNVPPACLVQSNWSLPYTSCSHLEGIEWDSTNNAQKSPGKRGQIKLVIVWTLSSYPQMECWKSQSPQFASSDWSLQSCLRGGGLDQINSLNAWFPVHDAYRRETLDPTYLKSQCRRLSMHWGTPQFHSLSLHKSSRGHDVKEISSTAIEPYVVLLVLPGG